MLSVRGRGIYKKDDGGFYGRAPGIFVKRIDWVSMYIFYYGIYTYVRIFLLLIFSYYQRYRQ